ncbi:MAG: UDP-N-acetylglucosamine--LPS N-acetylglucosamine transferase [Litoreibacter sp.]|nr:UDP-N-acetylglucosamine--LPS N-acetylglucosamine transferase [Litoreibacter sp.]MCY4333183.1 UDP-N-acetylglucosamine--LPS N-acetylglucosamine transferase [Litoreibacter sp.]
MTTPTVLAVASKGGHWRQLNAMAGAFSQYDVRFVSTDPELAEFCISECSRTEWWRGFVVAFQMIMIMWRLRPDVVVSTGALPGLVALVIARLFRARTVWIDSIANTESMSLSGRLSRPFAGLWLTQWPDVSRKTGAIYAGAVL